MRKLILGSILALALISCSVEPEPLHYGKDACHVCKMTLVDEKFGAEIVTRKGKVYKFDDLNCMVKFTGSDFESPDNILLTLVVDFNQPGSLIDGPSAIYVHSDDVRSPMGSQVACFSERRAMEELNGLWAGTVLDWSQVNELLE